MRRNTTLVAALVTALVAAAVPSVASAAVVINIENAIPTVVGTVIYLTVFATDATNSNERLNAYTIAIDGYNFTPDGVHFVVPGPDFGLAGVPKAPHPYVFGDFETVPPIENFSSTYNRLQFGATAVAKDDEADIGNGRDGLIRIGVFFPADWNPVKYPSTYTLVVDPRATSLAGLGAPIVATPGLPGVIAVLPEPTADALLLLPSLALLRRRRGQTTGQAA